jgi:thiol-disulfide isomerase/thioredoxin
VGTVTKPTRVDPNGTFKSPEDYGPMALIGQPIPGFTVEDEKGQLSSTDLNGKVVLLDFWGLLCPPCRASSPLLEKFHREYGPEGLVVLGVHSQGDKPVQIREYVETHGYTYRSTWRGGKLIKACGVTQLPTFVIIDRAGIVRDVFIGIDNLENNLITSIRPLLRS